VKPIDPRLLRYARATRLFLVAVVGLGGLGALLAQLVPVRISVNLGNQPMLLGANVEVKIQVAD